MRASPTANLYMTVLGLLPCTKGPAITRSRVLLSGRPPHTASPPHRFFGAHKDMYLSY